MKYSSIVLTNKNFIKSKSKQINELNSCEQGINFNKNWI